ncbi:NADH-quinone oxidoreductase subunit N [Nocardioides sp. TF02-7]|uniref:NADH-quinone oxidoreductase subunit N n=1 Tax=Nocardioides sp. TF02-7 TaxID=2917724 RepID=UPI0031F58EDB
MTAFMSAATKVAAFGALLRLFYVALDGERWSWQPMLWVIAIASMLVGAVLAVVQTDVKRMLAYSSVAHTGFILTGVLGAQASGELAEGQYTSLEGVLFYLTTYGFATIGAFALVTLVRDAGGEATSSVAWAGLGRRSPLVAGAFALFLLSMAGIPLTAGFVGKWAVFTSAMSAGAWPVVLVAIVSSIVAVAFYIRYIRVMYFAEPDPDSGVAVSQSSLLTVGTVAVCAAATVLLGVVPGPVLDLVVGAGDFIR